MKKSAKFLCCLSLVLAASSCVNRLKAQTITTYAGTGVAGWSGDGGVATAAKISGPNALVCDKSGSVYFCDALNNRVRMISPSGIVSLVAGNGIAGFMGDGGTATAARLNGPSGIALDTAGNIYISDIYNSVIRKIDKSGIITTFAGTPSSSGYSGDGGAATAAKFNMPYGLAFNSHNDLYVADHYNHVVRKITMSTGIVNAFAGTGTSGYSGDGGLATAAKLHYGNYLAIDTADNVYIADNGNHRIRVVSTSNIITTKAGTGVMGYTGDGGAATAAQLMWPAGLRSDTLGNLYLGDDGGGVRKINAAGTITTYAGSIAMGYGGDSGPATAATLNKALDVAISPAGAIFICDYGNNRIRKIVDCTLPPVGDTISCSPAVCVSSSVTATDSKPGGYWSVSNSNASVSPGSGVITGVTAGTTTISYSLVSACGTTVFTKTLTVNPQPVPVITATGSVMSTTIKYAAYSWKLAGIPIPGATDTSYTATISGTYSVIVTDTNGCTGTAVGTFILGVGSLSPNDINKDNISFRVYPNPNSGTFSVYLQSDNNEQALVTITNVVGQKVKEFTAITDHKMEIKLDQPAGIYLLSVTTKDRRFVQKITVE